LIEHGHREPWRYTPGQIDLFLEAIWREERSRHRQRIAEIRAAGVSADDYRKLMRDLKESDE
jgi:hypothetical protein